MAADIVADDGQSKRLRVDDTNHGENGGCKKESDKAKARDRATNVPLAVTEARRRETKRGETGLLVIEGDGAGMLEHV